MLELLKPDDLVFVFKAAKKLGIDSICLSGGEPTIWPNLPDAVRRLRDEGADLNIVTNGVHSLRVKEVFDYIREVHVSLHGVTEQEDKFRKVYAKKEYDKRTLETLDYLAQKGVILKLNVIATSRNTSEADVLALAKLAREFGATPRYIELYPSNLPAFKSNMDLQIQLEDMGWKKTSYKVRTVQMESSEHGSMELLRCGCAISHTLPFSDMICQRVNQVYVFPDGSFNYCRENNESVVEAINAIKKRDESTVTELLLRAINLIGSPCRR